jgi:predicted dehydrogenase
MTGRQLRIGIMSFAHVHTPGLIALSKALGAEVIGADPDEERAKASAQRLDIELADGYDDLLSRDLDGVIITAENVHHRELCERAAAAGCHVLCEKPLATTIADGRAMIEACSKAGVWLSVAFPMRYSPPIARVAATAMAGRLGRVLAMAGTNPGSCPGGWFADASLAGGGCMMDHTVHIGDIMCWITGSVPKSVYAQGNELITPEFGTDTGGLIAVTFEDGTIGTIDCSWSRLPTFPTWGAVTLEVVGEDGQMAADAFGERVEVFGDRARWESFGADPNLPMVADFFEAIRDDRPPFIDGTAGLNSSAIAIAGYRSKVTGQPVAVFED